MATDTTAAATTNGTEPTGIILHHLENSRSQRVLWLLEELGIPYTIKLWKRLPTQLAPPELKEVHPLGKSPVIQDGSLTIAESGAIVQYLIKKYGNGRFQPPKAGEITDLYYTHFAEGTLQPALSMHRVLGLVPDRVPFPIRWLARKITDGVRGGFINPSVIAAAGMVEKDLEKSTTGWFAGGDEPTTADFMMLLPLETLPRVMGDDSPPKVKAWLEKAHSRPAFRRILEKGGPYAYAK